MKFSTKDWLKQHGDGQALSTRLTVTVGDDRVVLDISLLPGASHKDLFSRGSITLPDISQKVTITIESIGKRRSATFSSREVVAILGGRWPDEENMVRVRRSVEDRKAYPMPNYEPPNEKSSFAQGQTKKPGSHSESKHS